MAAYRSETSASFERVIHIAACQRSSAVSWCCKLLDERARWTYGLSAFPVSASVDRSVCLVTTRAVLELVLSSGLQVWASGIRSLLSAFSAPAAWIEVTWANSRTMLRAKRLMMHTRSDTDGLLLWDCKEGSMRTYLDLFLVVLSSEVTRPQTPKN